jgi:hypothetical protein
VQREAFEWQGRGVDQHQALDPLGEVGRDVGGDPPAHGVPDDAGPGEAKQVHHPHQQPSRLAEHKALAAAAAKPEQVNDVDAAGASQRGHVPRPSPGRSP